METNPADVIDCLIECLEDAKTEQHTFHSKARLASFIRSFMPRGENSVAVLIGNTKFAITVTKE